MDAAGGRVREEAEMTAKKDAAGTKKEPTRTFESAMARLEKLIEEMEKGEMGLEQMIAGFEEGQGLIKYCSDKLNEVERKIEALVRKEDGETTTEPLDGPDGDVGGSGVEDYLYAVFMSNFCGCGYGFYW